MQNFIVNKLENEATDNDLLRWWNEYDSENNGDSQILESLEEWAEMLGDEPVEFARRVYFGDVQNWHDSYFWLNGYGNFESGNSLTSDKSPISFGDLASWLIEERQSYIQDWTDEWEELSEEEKLSWY